MDLIKGVFWQLFLIFLTQGEGGLWHFVKQSGWVATGSLSKKKGGLGTMYRLVTYREALSLVILNRYCLASI